MRKYFQAIVVGLCVLALGARKTDAGITFTSNSSSAITMNLLPQVNTEFFTGAAGTMASVSSDTLNDPQVSASALATYRYTLDSLTYSAVTAQGGDFSGPYTLYSTTINDSFYNASKDILISSGILNGHAVFSNSGDLWQITGVMTQTTGRSSSTVPDLSYGGKPISFSATFTAVGTNTSGQMVTIWRQTAAATPEPASMGIFGVGMMGMLLRRRRERFQI